MLFGNIKISIIFSFDQLIFVEKDGIISGMLVLESIPVEKAMTMQNSIAIILVETLLH